ncbi:quinol monooxygenase YgiN [Bosea sp. AK1]|uniref:putative quinol monooxygenase n=1 Tax=Bosea sp. AK1 TaxID=2587160 RepID=UPI00114DFD2F|nr:antibiotic biosynthesis monooxygenase [Bosea sp. AK1]TQI65358.1 quinol monooxygenase YgiN [Bosea sp. AK1]
MSKVPDNGVVSLATFLVRPGEVEAIAARMTAFAEELRLGGTARQYEFHVAWNKCDTFLLYAEFDDDAALARHGERTDVQALKGELVSALAGPVEYSLWTQFDATVRSDAAPQHTTLVRFKMRPDDVSPMLEEINRNSATAAGLLRFDLNRSQLDADHFLICARWQDRAAWEQQQSDSDYLAFRARTAPFYNGAPDRTLWRPMR